MMKSLTVAMMLVLGLAGGLQAAIALNQDFEGFTLGSLGTAGQGSTANAGGKWFATNAAVNPSIVQDPHDPNNNQCVQIVGGQAMLAGYSVASPIATGTPFILSFSVCPVTWTATDVGSFYLYSDNLTNLDPDKTRGIAMFTYTEGLLLIWDGKQGEYRAVRSGQLSLFDVRDTWIDFKVHVTTWDAGDGYGRYDLWYNLNQGEGWIVADRNNPFLSSKLHNGVNAVLFRPRTPSYGVLEYFDNIYLTTEPLDCQDAQMFAGGPQAADYDSDCVVDFPDLGAWAADWLVPLSNATVDWDYKWDCDELPADSGLFESFVGWGSLGEPTQSVSAGIYSASTADSGGGDLLYQTVEGIYDANYPVMMEWRSKMISTTPSPTGYIMYTTMVAVYDYGYGIAGLWFRPEMHYTDAEGWSTYRVVTLLDELGQLAELQLYEKHADGTWWFADRVPVALWTEGITRDLIYVGDGSGGSQGAWQEDYFYWTQNEAAIDSFLADVALTPYDLTADGLINLEDFALFSSEWLVDIAP